ncbi:MAG: DUF4153 domain-containing protein [Alphaproteobacteria bacterium]|nr:DUF4153 domain-containing protein [Alphaproteobacteria bacterium]
MSNALEKLSFLLPVDGIKETLRRFPLSSLCAFVLFLISVLSIHDLIDDDELTGRIAVLAACGYFWFGIMKLLAESRGFGKSLELMLSLFVFVGLGLVVFLSEQWVLYAIFWFPSLFLLIVISPYTVNDDNHSFWFFNRMTWFGVLLSVLAAIVWGSGLSAALGSIDYLFDVDIPDEAYGDIWSFTALIFAALYALSLVPKEFSFTKESCTVPPGLPFLVNWVLAPLVCIYMLILYAYLAKILFIQELPRGQLAYMITGFGGVGVVTYLLAWPLREEGGVLLRLVYRCFFPSLLLPVVMQFIAIGERIHQYGITEQRYMIALTAVWFAGIAIVYTFKKSLPIKYIPAGLAVLFVLGSFGSWGGVSLSGHSQFNRLEKLLVKYEALEDGCIVEAKKEIPFEDRQNISSILDYFNNTDRDNWIKPLADEEIYSEVRKITKLIGFEYVSRYEGNRHAEGQFYFSQSWDDNNSIVDVRNYDFILQTNYMNFDIKNQWSKTWEFDSNSGMATIKAYVEGDYFVIDVEDMGDIRVNLVDYVIKELEHDKYSNKRKMVIETKNSNFRLRVNINSISGDIKNGNLPVIENANFRILIGAL